MIQYKDKALVVIYGNDAQLMGRNPLLELDGSLDGTSCLKNNHKFCDTETSPTMKFGALSSTAPTPKS
jgi:hypothetical protein